jgi:hypothetical protein
MIYVASKSHARLTSHKCKMRIDSKKIVEKISPAFQLSVTKNIQLNNSQFNTIIIHMTFNLIQVQLNS